MRGPGGLREEREMKDSKSVGRRRFLSLAGAAGAGMALSKQATPAPAAEKPVAGWPTDFKPASTAPRWYPRDAPKPGEKIHEFDMELVLTRHEIMLACEMDGVPLGTQYPVGYQQTFQYLFRAQPAGTHFYHCHNMTPLH